jgi:Right handed beta helix region
MKSLSMAIGAVLAAGVLAPFPAQALTLNVDCSAGKTIAQALKQGDERKPLVVVIKGTCNESIRIVRDDVTLRGDPVAGGIVHGPDAGVNTIEILASRVTLDNLTVTGGRVGVQVQDSHGALVLDTVIQQTALDGMRIFVGDADVTGCTVQQTGGAGILANRGSVLRVATSEVRDNPGNGISTEANSTLAVNGSTVSHNGGNGIDLGRGSQGTIGTSTISDNGTDANKPGNGVSAWGASGAHIGSDNVITGNREHGVLMAGGSTAHIFNNTITGNGGHGIMGYFAATLVIDNGTISDNNGNGIDCTADCSAQIVGATIQGNAGSGINLAFDSTLMLWPPMTDATGNAGLGLNCDDDESSAVDIANLLGGANCSGF